MKLNFKSKILYQILIGLLIFSSGYIFRYISHKNHWLDGQTYKEYSVRKGSAGENIKYTNPLLECEQSESSFTELAPFKEDVERAALKIEKQNSIDEVSIYFRDLNNGPWFGIDEDKSFSPASLLKLPLAIAYYKLNGIYENYTSREIQYNGPDETWPKIVQTIKPKEELVIGQKYTVEELIKRMLSYSDNTAYYLLFSNINVVELEKVYSDFGIDLNGPGVKDDSIITVQNYSSFFRILFNASYLTVKDSEKVLSYLSNNEFKEGLIAGVPGNIEVAHKFGERETGDNNQQIHDCGIIYYPGHPYLLCVMTKGSNLDNQSKAIQQISSLVYKEIETQISK